MIAIILFALILIIFLLISAAVVYHLIRYSPEKDKAAMLIGVYIVISLILLFFSITAFGQIDWKELLRLQ